MYPTDIFSRIQEAFYEPMRRHQRKSTLRDYLKLLRLCHTVSPLQMLSSKTFVSGVDEPKVVIRQRRKKVFGDRFGKWHLYLESPNPGKKGENVTGKAKEIGIHSHLTYPTRQTRMYLTRIVTPQITIG